VKSKEVEIFRRGDAEGEGKYGPGIRSARRPARGLRNSRPRQGPPAERLAELLNWLPALTLPEKAGQAYGTMRADMAARGQMIGNNDLWIASHALAAELTLVTNNETEFRRVRRLKMQNWAE
jgi:predicted nucleic acid-binding protein